MALQGLLDREHELQTLLSLVDGAAAGRGGLAVIEGVAGIGKTRLLAAAGELAEGRGLRPLMASGSELERDFPFGVVRQLLEPVLAGMDEPERSRAFDGAAAHARPLLSPDHIAKTDFGDPDYATLYGLYWFTAALSARQSLLVCVDDVHWADAPSVRFLSYLVRRAEGLPVLVCCALRAAEARSDVTLAPALPADATAEVIRPSSLTAEGIGDMVRAVLGDGSAPEFVETCLELTGGNPFYLRSLLVEAAAQGVQPQADDLARLRTLGAGGISRLVLSRLSALESGAPELAQALCTLGDGAALREASGLAGLDADTGAKAAAALERASITAGGERLRFVHPVVRTSIDQDMPSIVRAERHLQAARLLHGEGADIDRIAAQLMLAEPDADGWAVERLRAAAARALSRGAPKPQSPTCERRWRGSPKPSHAPKCSTSLHAPRC